MEIPFLKLLSCCAFLVVNTQNAILVVHFESKNQGHRTSGTPEPLNSPRTHPEALAFPKKNIPERRLYILVCSKNHQKDDLLMIFWQDDVSWQEDNAVDAEEVGELLSPQCRWFQLANLSNDILSNDQNVIQINQIIPKTRCLLWFRERPLNPSGFLDRTGTSCGGGVFLGGAFGDGMIECKNV